MKIKYKISFIPNKHPDPQYLSLATNGDISGCSHIGSVSLANGEDTGGLTDGINGPGIT